MILGGGCFSEAANQSRSGKDVVLTISAPSLFEESWVCTWWNTSGFIRKIEYEGLEARAVCADVP